MFSLFQRLCSWDGRLHRPALSRAVVVTLWSTSQVDEVLESVKTLTEEPGSLASCLTEWEKWSSLDQREAFIASMDMGKVSPMSTTASHQ